MTESTNEQQNEPTDWGRRWRAVSWIWTNLLHWHSSTNQSFISSEKGAFDLPSQDAIVAYNAEPIELDGEDANAIIEHRIHLPSFLSSFRICS